jgi:hypothetical protein
MQERSGKKFVVMRFWREPVEGSTELREIMQALLCWKTMGDTNRTRADYASRCAGEWCTVVRLYNGGYAVGGMKRGSPGAV